MKTINLTTAPIAAHPGSAVQLVATDPTAREDRMRILTRAPKKASHL